MPQSSAELAKKFGGAPTTADLAKQFGGTPATVKVPTDSEGTATVSLDMGDRSWLDDVKDLVVGAWQKQPIHPVDIVTGTAEAIKHPIDTAKGVLEAQGKPAERAMAAFKRGDYVSGTADVINYLLPIIGPQISDAQDRARKGELSLAGLAGESLGIGAQVAMPEAAKNLRVSTPRLSRPANPSDAAAVEFGEQRGIPIDAATATGNRAVAGAQHLADRSVLGASVAGRAQQAQEAGLARVGRELAEQAHPKAAVSPYQAGEVVQKAIQKRVDDYGAEATTAYDALRQIEADPKLTRKVQIRIPTTAADGSTKMSTVTVDMQMPVDLRAAKAALRPVYERMMRQMPVAQQRADPALHAMKNVLDSTDYMPASVIDMDLSAIKSLARTDGVRNPSQGLAAFAVRSLDDAVQKAVAQGGKPAVDALKNGRAATVNKYGAADLLKQLREEPRQVFDQLVWGKDAGIDRLTAIARQSPQAMPQMARAWLDDLMDKATSQGGFAKAGTLQAAWENLGPKTKALLFKDPAYIKDLDNFFLLAKKAAANPNPSGTAHNVALMTQGGLLLTDPVTGVATAIGLRQLSSLLHSPRFVRALTRGAVIPVGAKSLAASIYADLMKATEQPGAALVPATVDNSGTSPQ